jgi:Glyoxalase-like domain
MRPMDVLATDRRTALRALGLVAVSALTRSEFIMEASGPAVTAADHLLLGVADLDRGIQWVEERTGVRPVVGGSHPGRGTRNALLSLGAKQYLEVIAPDPAQSTYTFQIDLRALKEPRLVTWAAATSDIEAVARGAKAAGRSVVGPTDGSRARPDGRTLRWRSLAVASTLVVGIVEPMPFFIQWAADAVHPASDSPAGCQLKALRIAHPEPAAVVDALRAVGIDAEVALASDAALYATVSTPKGVIELH